MTVLRISLAALVGIVLGTGTTRPRPADGPIAPAATAVVLQLPAACEAAARRAPAAPRPADRSALPPAARRLVAGGAQLTVVCSASDATVAVIRAAVTHRAVLGAGPDVRAALSLAAADHPGRRLGPLR